MKFGSIPIILKALTLVKTILTLATLLHFLYSAQINDAAFALYPETHQSQVFKIFNQSNASKLSLAIGVLSWSDVNAVCYHTEQISPSPQR